MLQNNIIQLCFKLHVFVRIASLKDWKMLIKYHLSREVALCLKLYFFDLHPPRAIEIDSAVNEHLLLRTFHWMHLPEQYTRLVHVHRGFGFWTSVGCSAFYSFRLRINVNHSQLSFSILKPLKHATDFVLSTKLIYQLCFTPHYCQC